MGLTVNTATHYLPVTDPSGVGQARRAAAALARRDGATGKRVAAVTLAVTELGTNLVKHADGGDLFLRSLPAAGRGPAGFEVTSVDWGPGIPDVDAAELDGFSTTRTAGTGLGAVRRAADRLEIHSVPGRGTVLRALFRAGTTDRWEIGIISRPHPGETDSGDRLWIDRRGSRATFVLVDALGHGPVAGRVAERAARSLDDLAPTGDAGETAIPPVALVQELHRALGGTRGAAVSAVVADGAGGFIDFAGIGNVTGRLVTPQKSRTFLGFPGIVGHQTRSLRQNRYDWPRGGLLVLHTDGLSERWDLSGRPSLFAGSATLLAAVLYQRSSRHDDAAVVVARYRPRPEPGRRER